MMVQRITWVFMIVLSTIILAYAQMNLPPVHPEESARNPYDRSFSFDQALSSLEIIRASLQSFQKLAKEAQGKISKKQWKDIVNTDWEIQNLGFINHPKAIEGTLRQQDYLIKKLTFQLTMEQVRQGVKQPSDLVEAKRAYEQAEKGFQEFWEIFHIAD